MSVLTIAGSPARQSRSSALLGYVDDRLAARGIETKRMGLRDVPAVDLVEMRCHSEAVRIWRAWVSHAQALVIATPVYKASLGGGLKALLDLLPPDALAGKLVLPLATGGSPAHLLALEYGFKPVLSALGARHILSGVYATEDDIEFSDTETANIAGPLRKRLDDAIDELARHVPGVRPAASLPRRVNGVFSACCKVS